jgi:hypothetical protein
MGLCAWQKVLFFEFSGTIRELTGQVLSFNVMSF